MNYYWFNSQETLQKAEKHVLKKKLVSIINRTQKLQKKKSRECYKNLLHEEKGKIKEYQRRKYQESVQYKKEALKNK